MKAERRWRFRTGIVAMLATGALLGLSPCAADELHAYSLDLSQTTVSGISSGAFMAVQFGTAHAATVSGVAATAGGPYFCAGCDSWAGSGVGRVMARCMQGDPAYPAQPITDGDLHDMHAAARAWSARGLNDDVVNLKRQRVWMFHGYNDGIVKRPVSDALQTWYEGFVPAAQIFYKNELRAAHAQISASCADGLAAACNACATTGGTFINSCPDGAAGAPTYDAAGAALQLFYGPLERRSSAALKGQVRAFDQRPYIQRGGKPLNPIRASMAETGYLYVPAECAAGEACRLHVAFHGCEQQAELIGKDFVTSAGFNEWADANRIVVLYPQTAATSAVPITPFNPQGCWDWWGYTDFGYDMPGHFATRDGVQISAVWRMVEQLASGAPGRIASAATPMPELRVIDRAADQVALAWTPVAGSAGYRIYRGEGEHAGAGSFMRAVTAVTVDGPSWVDRGLKPQTIYRYLVRSVDASGAEGASSAQVMVSTGATPPACDPYFSLAKDRVVGRDNKPTNAVCP